MKRVLALVVLLGMTATLSAETITAQGGQLKLDVPEEWKKANPRIQMIEHEYALPGDPAPARLTMMSAGGTVQENLDRWKKQFSGVDEQETKTEKFKVGDRTVHLLSLQGTYEETMGGPFAGGRTVKRPDYAMLGAVIVAGEDGRGAKYFIKAVGPQSVIEKNAEPFKKMLKELQAQ